MVQLWKLCSIPIRHVNQTSNVNFSKKRKNRMRSDSAAAIAANRSGVSTNAVINRLIQLKNNRDTDSLVDNEAIVVYDERTSL